MHDCARRYAGEPSKISPKTNWVKRIGESAIGSSDYCAEHSTVQIRHAVCCCRCTARVRHGDLPPIPVSDLNTIGDQVRLRIVNHDTAISANGSLYEPTTQPFRGCYLCMYVQMLVFPRGLAALVCPSLLSFTSHGSIKMLWTA